MKAHQNKLANLIKNSALSFKHEETISNMSSFKLSHKELDILKRFELCNSPKWN